MHDMVNFAWASISRSIGISRYTCFLLVRSLVICCCKFLLCDIILLLHCCSTVMNGTDAVECKKTIDVASARDHEEELYCRTCHGRLFGPKGYGFAGGAGTMLSMDTCKTGDIPTKYAIHCLVVLRFLGILKPRLDRYWNSFSEVALHWLPLDTTQAWCMLLSRVCLSVGVCMYVCVCHTPVYINMCKRRITQAAPHNNPRTLVFLCQTSR